MSGRLVWMAVAAMTVAGCYGPSAAPGVRCSESGACPNGQECDESRDICVLIGTIGDVDAPAGDGGVDAAVDAALADGPSDAPIDAPANVAPQFRGFTEIDNGAASMTIASPAGVVVGDLLLAHVSSDNATAAEIGTPAGWTQIVSVDGGSAHCTLAYYRFVTAPGASYTWTFPNASGVIRLMAFRGVSFVGPINAFAADAMAGGVQPVAPSITTTVGNTTLVVMFAHDLSSTLLDPVPAMTQVYNGYTGQISVMSAYAAHPTAGPTGARTTNAPGAGPTTVISVALAPD